MSKLHAPPSRSSTSRTGQTPSPVSAGAWTGPNCEAADPAGSPRTGDLAAAAALTDGRHAGWTYTLTGPAAYDYGEVAAAVGRAAGRAVVHADVPPAAFAAGLAAAGLLGFVVEAMVGMAAAIRDGRFAAVTGDVAALTERAPVDGLALLEDALRAPAPSAIAPVET